MQASTRELDGVLEAVVDQGEPRQQLERPRDDLLVPGLTPELEGHVPTRLGGLTVTDVELEAGEQGC